MKFEGDCILKALEPIPIGEPNWLKMLPGRYCINEPPPMPFIAPIPFIPMLLMP